MNDSIDKNGKLWSNIIKHQKIVDFSSNINLQDDKRLSRRDFLWISSVTTSKVVTTAWLFSLGLWAATDYLKKRTLIEEEREITMKQLESIKTRLKEIFYNPDSFIYKSVFQARDVTEFEFQVMDTSSGVNKLSQHAREHLEKIYLLLLGSNDSFYKIRLLNLDWNEVLSVDKREWHPRVVPSSKLLKKSHRDYFIQSLDLNRDDAHISMIDPNLELNDSHLNDIFVYRLSVKVFSKNNNHIWYLIISYNSKNFLTFGRTNPNHQDSISIVNEKWDIHEIKKHSSISSNRLDGSRLEEVSLDFRLPRYFNNIEDSKGLNQDDSDYHYKIVHSFDVAYQIDNRSMLPFYTSFIGSFVLWISLYFGFKIREKLKISSLIQQSLDIFDNNNKAFMLFMPLGDKFIAQRANNKAIEFLWLEMDGLIGVSANDLFKSNTVSDIMNYLSKSYSEKSVICFEYEPVLLDNDSVRYQL